MEPLQPTLAGVPRAPRAPVVACIRWPAEEAERERLARAGRPRILLVEPGAPLPLVVDELEDWLPLDAASEDLLRRVANLESRLRP